jgi:hypothetical protein
MERFTHLPTVFALALLCAPGTAQVPRSLPAAPAPQPVVRQSAARVEPFSLGGERLDSSALIDFPSPEKISQQDRALQISSLAAISQRANAAGLDFDQGTWETQQIVCSALPGHLFLTFTRQTGTGEASAFTASIPRGAGQVRVIPILRRGYSLFSPAPVNALTLSAFNHIRTEEHPAQPSEWLATGLCYAALAGARPQIALAGEENQPRGSTAAPGSLTMAAGSGGEISFIDLNAPARHNLWTMSFDGGGRLLKATRTSAPQSRQRVIQRTATEPQGKPVPQSAAVQGKPVTATEPAARTVSTQ